MDEGNSFPHFNTIQLHTFLSGINLINILNTVHPFYSYENSVIL